MTTTSAGNGTSAGDGGNDEWSWFSPPRSTAEQDQHEEDTGGHDGYGGHQPADQAATPAPRPETTAENAPTAERTTPTAERTPRAAERAPAPPPVTEATPERFGWREWSRAARRPGRRSSEEHQRAGEPGATGAARHGQPPPRGPEPVPERPDHAPAAGRDPANGPEPSPDAVRIRRSLAEVEPVSDALTAYFYAMLFVQYPQMREMFPAAMDTQRDRLFGALLTAARLVDDPEILTEYLANLGRGHRKYGTLPEHYPAVGECLIGALTQYTRSWDEETEAAWVRAYTAISQIMIDAAAQDELRAPAWWNAEIVSHEMGTSDIAVLTVRPDQPYPFRAGQYASLETPWWPRVWRHYSFASAPRSDGLLTFHVKAVPAGWVSNALVHRARPGDVVRLGPPAGSMTVDHGTDNGLLCLGGGTGIAPIKAMVEDVAEHGRPRPVEVFYGARSDHDLYDLETMLALEQRHPWLAVRPVVSDIRTGPPSGLRDLPGSVTPLEGQLPEVIRRYGPWSAYMGYLSGPPGMIRSGVDALRGVGIPPHRIRHDSLEELVNAVE